MLRHVGVSGSGLSLRDFTGQSFTASASSLGLGLRVEGLAACVEAPPNHGFAG